MSRRRALTSMSVAVTVALLLTIAGPTEAKDVRYDPQTVYFTYCHSHPPAARISARGFVRRTSSTFRDFCIFSRPTPVRSAFRA